MGKVYRKYMDGNVSVLDSGEVFHERLDSFVAEEDIYIVGFGIGGDLSQATNGYETADQGYYWDVELSFAALKGNDAILGRHRFDISRFLFGSPASGAGWQKIGDFVTYFLPGGDYVEMVEGEILNLLGHFFNGLGHTIVFYAEAVIYYKKTKS